jgi:hypothetical protein
MIMTAAALTEEQASDLPRALKGNICRFGRHRSRNWVRGGGINCAIEVAAGGGRLPVDGVQAGGAARPPSHAGASGNSSGAERG